MSSAADRPPTPPAHAPPGHSPIVGRSSLPPSARPGEADTPSEDALYQPLFSIGTVARRSGVSAAAIRSWEERYGVVTPQRDGSGRRLYSALELAQISWLGRQVEAGVPASEAHRLLASNPSVALAEVPPVTPTKPIPWSELTEWVTDEISWLEAFLSEVTVNLSAPSLLFGVLARVSHGPLLVLLAEPPTESSSAAAELFARLSRPAADFSAVPLSSVPEEVSTELLALRLYSDASDPFSVGALCTVAVPVPVEGHLALVWVSFEAAAAAADASHTPSSSDRPSDSLSPHDRLVSAASMAAQAIGARLLAAQARRSFASLMR